MESFFWWLAVISTGILSLQLLLNLVGVDFDHDIDLPTDYGDASLSSIMAFLSVGGWSGYLSHQVPGISAWGSALAALLAGSAGFIGAVFLLQKLRSLEQSGNADLQNAIGKVAEVYLNIPAQRNGEGQVQVIFQGRLHTLEAVTESDALTTGQKVFVYGVEGDKLLVEKCDPALLDEGEQTQ